MPELPEVEVVRMQLAEHVLNKKIVKVSATVGKIIGDNPEFSELLTGRFFKAVNRKGKLLIFDTDDPDLHILGHLKMTGQLIYVDEQGRAGGGHTLTEADLDLPHKHTHVSLEFEDGSKLYFNDVRKFGFLKLADTDTVNKEKAKYGVEPISKDYTQELFDGILEGRRGKIKALLLTQKYLAGLGNIYVDEACYLARVRPDRVAGSLNSKEKRDLFVACRQVLEESIKVGGTTFYDFRDAGGGKGGYFSQLKVFKREGQKCFSCDNEITKTRVAGRGTHWCPHCQK